MDPSLPLPAAGRTFAASRRIRLADMDATGRVRLDALARFLQDVAIDDVQETGWGTPDHLWFVRRIRLEVREPMLADRELELVTWCSGLAAIAAGRRWSVVGDRGGRIEVDSVWIHLDAHQRPARIESFGVYEEATGGRPVSTRLELPAPPGDAPRRPWPLRSADVDLHGHINNAVHWQAIEHVLARSDRADDELVTLCHKALFGPVVVEVDYRDPLELDDALEVAAAASDGSLRLAFSVAARVRAVARITPV